MKPTLAALLFLTASAAAAAAPTDVEQWLAARVADGSVAAATFATIEGADLRTSGFGHVANGKPPGPATQFQAGSVTKVFTNLLLAEMEMDAEMEASDALQASTTLGEVFGKSLAPRNKAVAGITLQQLATHHSGLPRMPANMDASGPDPYHGYDSKDLLAGLSGTRDKQPLGKFYAYSNFGAAVLGEALGRADGRGYRVALDARVLQRLGTKRTGFAPDDDRATATVGGKPVDAWRFDAFAPAGGLWTSASDLAQLVCAYFGWTHSMAHDTGKDGERIADAGPFRVSRIWHLAPAGTETILWHNGETLGFHAMVAFRQDEQRGLVVLLAGDADPTEVVLRALGHTPAKPAAQEFDAAVQGQYQFTPAFGIGVFERNGWLFEQATGQQAVSLHAVGDDWYALGDVDASLHFVREDGKPVALELAQNSVLQKASRSADVAAAVARKEIELPADVLAGYAGRYELAPNVVIAVRERKGGIEVQLTGQQWFPVYASAKDRFFYRVVDAELEFTRDADGAITAVTLHQAGTHQRAPRSE